MCGFAPSLSALGCWEAVMVMFRDAVTSVLISIPECPNSDSTGSSYPLTLKGCGGLIVLSRVLRTSTAESGVYRPSPTLAFTGPVNIRSLQVLAVLDHGTPARCDGGTPL